MDVLEAGLIIFKADCRYRRYRLYLKKVDEGHFWFTNGWVTTVFEERSSNPRTSMTRGEAYEILTCLTKEGYVERKVDMYKFTDKAFDEWGVEVALDALEK
jgi:hypothetical protein